MATLRRDDGLQFIIHPYRELFEPERSSVLKRKIRALAHTHGENVRIFKQNEGRIEAVFSQDPGLLLGETLWLYLNKPANLIYCEILPEHRQALLVIIRNGLVFVDTRMSFASLIDEFISLSISDEKYAIYVYGDVPLAETKETGKFAFDRKNVSSFQILDEPLLIKLSVYEEAQLQPLALALTSPYLGKSKVVPIILTIAIVITILIAWHIYREAPRIVLPDIKLIHPGPIENPYSEYYQSLATPEPQQQMVELVLMAQLVNNLPGWKINNISFDGSNYMITLVSVGGSIAQVQSWAKLNDVDIELQTNGILLTLPSKLKDRSQFAVIYPLQQVLGLLIDNINRVLNGKNVTFSNIISYNRYKEANATIKINEIYAGVLMLIGQEINKLPVAVTAVKMTLKNDLFSGNITLRVLGD